MKVVISSTFDNNYLFFIPIVTYCWNRLGVDVICFMPRLKYEHNEKYSLIQHTIWEHDNSLKNFQVKWFDALEHKEATYAQCSRLYAACLDLPEDEILVTGDADMALFQIPQYVVGTFSVFGADLVPDKQLPMCYLTATVKQWRETFNIGNKTYQKCLDEILAHEDCEHFRGNMWGRDQETAYNNITRNRPSYTAIHRARPGTQFASHRVDRDDINWRHYVDDNLIDAHLWRPGYEENNFKNIMELLTMKYPNDNFDWLIEYKNKYLEIL